MWDDAWDSAPTEANTFREELRKYEKHVGKLSSAGSLASVQKNSTSQTYANYGAGNLTQVELKRAWRTLIQTFDRISASLTGPTDETIYAQGKSELSQPCTEAYAERTHLRLGYV